MGKDLKGKELGKGISQSGYRTIPLTEEVVAILKKQKEKNKRISEISTEWEEFVFLCRKGTPVKNTSDVTGPFEYWNYDELICSYYRGKKEKRNGIGSRSTYGNVMAH